ncbi:MAG: hypothetical protein LBK26_00500 [Rickettsiales bacterium]|jgi:hypothetical protein|nr:hypothetical protein [Rickettsiales bacterium]
MYKISYAADGSQAEFAFDFEFFQPADIRVAINEELLEPSEYNLASSEDMHGGIISFASAPEQNARIDIFRRINLERFIDYQPTAKIDPEQLNADFNFLLEAFRDLYEVEIDVIEWKNIHDNVIAIMNTALAQVQYAHDTIRDKMSGGAVLGLYNNLVTVLSDALPQLINDYGSITEPAANETKDDYGNI